MHKIQKLKTDINTAWDFFSSPKNLSQITPPEMRFKIISELPEKMYEGMIINYFVNVLPFVKVRWMTEITKIDKNNYFIDEQRIGPYKLWHHEHHFRSENGLTIMEDIIHYVLPYGILGTLIHPVIVKPSLERIFNYRELKLTELFG